MARGDSAGTDGNGKARHIRAAKFLYLYGLADRGTDGTDFFEFERKKFQ
jgi:hypothetical protein